MSTDISGVGQPGFVDRYGLGGPDRPYDVDEVAARVRDLGLRTVRLAVVDQHGVPRAKMMSSAAAIAAIKTWVFKPSMRCGKAMAGGVFTFQSTFELGD